MKREIDNLSMDRTTEHPEWVSIPGGPAWVGGNFPGEGPPHQVSIPSFLMQRYAISNRAFWPFIDDGGYRRREFWSSEGSAWLQTTRVERPAFWDDEMFNTPEQPVTGISFYEAEAYANWRGERLPTECEWEKAARGLDCTLYPWGNRAPSLQLANFAPDFLPINRAPVRVDAFPEGDSPTGCRQMAGNVYEWCLDFFHIDTPAGRSSGLLIESPYSARRVLKGGAWTTGESRLRVSARWSAPPHLRDNILGMRLVREVSVEGDEL